MKISGQIILVFISIAFTAYQKLVHAHPFFTIDFFIFTMIAWVVGWQYDKARYFEKTARASEESYKQLLDSFPESIYIHQDYRIVYANEAGVGMLKASKKDDLIGTSIFDYLVPDYVDRSIERIKLAKKEKKPLSHLEYRLKRLDGTIIIYEVSSLSIIFGGKEAVLTIGRDITEQKNQTERLLQKSEKLALLGQMAAGIAHEIRNPLTSIKGFIQLFRTSQQREEYYDIVLSELDRINGIVGEFLLLAKPQASVFIEKDIRGLLNDVITLINTQSILSNVEIRVDFEPDLAKISCEENQLKQVFINLLKNAIEAMPHGGVIEVTVSEKEEGKIVIKIKDQGIGIPAERLSTLGEPFYTTKEKGTGLGLMTCFKIIEGHNGELKIHSKEHVGTTVEISLPTITQPLLKKELNYS